MQKKSIINRILVVSLCMLFIVSMFSECGSKQSSNTFKAGTYTAEAQGKEGPVKVEVIFSETKITDIKIVGQSETSGLGDAALKKCYKADTRQAITSS